LSRSPHAAKDAGGEGPSQRISLCADGLVRVGPPARSLHAVHPAHPGPRWAFSARWEAGLFSRPSRPRRRNRAGVVQVGGTSGCNAAWPAGTRLSGRFTSVAETWDGSRGGYSQPAPRSRARGRCAGEQAETTSPRPASGLLGPLVVDQVGEQGLGRSECAGWATGRRSKVARPEEVAPQRATGGSGGGG